MSDAYFTYLFLKAQPIQAVSSIVALVSTALCSALLSQLSFSTNNFYMLVLYLNIVANWLFSMAKLTFIIVNNTILLDPSAHHITFPFLLVLKTCELVALWATMSTNLVMIISFAFILYNCGKMQKMDERPVHIVSCSIFLIYFLTPLLIIASANSFYLTRTHCFLTIPTWTSYLSMTTLVIQFVAMVIMFTSWRTIRKSEHIVPKLKRYLYIFTALLISFTVCNGPYTIERLTNKGRMKFVFEVCLAIKHFEGVLNTAFLYFYFIKKGGKVNKKMLASSSEAEKGSA
jgi:hypothetical protein